ncbi:MAG: GAF domain-containing protein [Anaerolineae bacterium]
MTRANLKRILSKRGEGASIVRAFVGAAGSPAVVRDMDGRLLLGTPSTASDESLERHPVRYEGDTVGWVSGGDHAALIANLLTHLVTREAEKEALLEEVLDLYRQINLLFNLSEKLATSLVPATVARLALAEASRLIEATGGAVLLRSEGTDLHQAVATIGHGIEAQTSLKPDDGIVGAAAASARGEIINDVRLDSRYVEDQAPIRSLICAPLKSKNNAIGTLVLISEAPVTYTAADLKLLNTLASQAAPAIENALLHEKMLREAREREARLRRQVEELRIELDEAKQRQKVAEITESDYYQRLRDQAGSLRNIISSGPFDSST